MKLFILETELLKNHPDIMSNFDKYFNMLFTRAFNRGQNLIKKQNDAMKKRSAKSPKTPKTPKTDADRRIEL